VQTAGLDIWSPETTRYVKNERDSIGFLLLKETFIEIAIATHIQRNI
jgi:hypothetical protein